MQGNHCFVVVPAILSKSEFNRNDREYITHFFGRYLQKIEQVQECDSLISTVIKAMDKALM